MYIGVDVGLKRIGLAYSPDGKITVPLEPVLRKTRNQAAADLAKILAEKNCTHLVVGLPLGASSQDEMKRRILHFVGLLQFKGAVSYQDESFSSKEAAEISRGLFGRKKNGKQDSLAAKIILDRFLGL